MSKFNGIDDNPMLEHHFIVYVGLRHMHRYFKNHIDPTSQYDPGEQQLFFATLRDGAYDDLTIALLEEAELHTSDNDFKSIVQSVIEDIVKRKGMEAILQITKTFVREMEGREDVEITNRYYPIAKVARCPDCSKIRVPMTIEDLPRDLFEAHAASGMGKGAFWYCVKCHHISNSTQCEG